MIVSDVLYVVHQVKLLGVDAAAIADGVPSVVLNLVWSIILHFQAGFFPSSITPVSQCVILLHAQLFIFVNTGKAGDERPPEAFLVQPHLPIIE